MSKKTIVLADNSYTIRRIVELSFSEEQDIQLVSFENSLNLREKLIELRPHIVLVDIKLPEFNGYQVCRFVQDTPELQHTKVFLLKGGFEPIDENQLQNLRYVDIITKPFDSNALVSNIKNLLTDMPEPSPVKVAPPAAATVAPPPRTVSTPAAPPMGPRVAIPTPAPTPAPLPEDLPEIDAMPEADSEISFSDIKDEIDSDNIMAGEDFSPMPSSYPDDDILPSEEITQRQSSHADRDSLAVAGGDDLDNPFDDYMSMEDSPASDDEMDIKQNIALQEKELEIGSLTVEEMYIQKDIERMKQTQDEEMGAGMGLDDIGVPEFEPEEPMDTEGDVAEVRDDDTSEMFPGQGLEMEDEDEPLFDGGTINQEPQYQPEPETGMPEEEEFSSAPAFGAEEEDLFTGSSQMPSMDFEPEPEAVPKMDFEDMDSSEIDEFIVPPASPETSVPEPPVPPFMEAEEEVFGMPEEAETQVEPEVEEYSQGYEPEESIEPDVTTLSLQPEQILPPEEELLTPEPEPQYLEEPEYEPQQVAVPEPPQPQAPQVTEQAPVTPVQHDEILRKIEDKLTHAIKEMLWEIVPPLAEKIIKEEIAKLTAETKSSFK